MSDSSSIVEVSVRRSAGYSSVPERPKILRLRTFEDVETGTIWAEFAPRRLPWTMAVSLPVLSASRWAEDAFARSCLLCQGRFGYPTLQGGRGVGMATRYEERGNQIPSLDLLVNFSICCLCFQMFQISEGMSGLRAILLLDSLPHLWSFGRPEPVLINFQVRNKETSHGDSLPLGASSRSNIHHISPYWYYHAVPCSSAVHKGHISSLRFTGYFSPDSSCQLLRRIVGDCPELGDWQPTEGVKLRTSSYAFPIWYLGRLWFFRGATGVPAFCFFPESFECKVQINRSTTFFGFAFGILVIST